METKDANRTEAKPSHDGRHAPKKGLKAPLVEQMRPASRLVSRGMRRASGDWSRRSGVGGPAVQVVVQAWGGRQRQSRCGADGRRATTQPRRSAWSEVAVRSAASAAVLRAPVV